MPVETTETLTITCDNPNCPGHGDLASDDRAGWLFVTSEVYGQPTAQHVYGNAECAEADVARAFIPAEAQPPL